MYKRAAILSPTLGKLHPQEVKHLLRIALIAQAQLRLDKETNHAR